VAYRAYRADRAYRLHDVAVDGGTLRVGEWGPEDVGNGGPDASAVPTVIALHGITASHVGWAVVARALPGRVRLIAPDLRGRGRSAGLPGPYGMARHAADLEAVIEALDLPRATLVGHSMGGFVALVAAHLYPDRFSDVLLVDGGLPLELPPGVSKENLLAATLGPAARRLSMTFPDVATYVEFWKAHPAFAADQWSEAIVDYARYDLTGTEPSLRPATSLEAVRQDSMDLYGGGAGFEALTELKLRQPDHSTPDHSGTVHNGTVHSGTVTLLTAPRGLLNETPGLYSPNAIGRWRAELPGVTIREVPDVNHYTIVMGTAGADAVARELLRVVGAGDPTAGVPG
jgi:lipase